MKIQRLEPRTRPKQQRAEETVHLILETAAAMLEEDGFEELTTNKICKAAGITTPALYHYFPNKYAILNELAQRLMEVQNAGLYKWVSDLGTCQPTVEDFEVSLSEQLRITRDFTGGVAIQRTLYATPQLIDIRLSSHWSAVSNLRSAQTWIKDTMSDDELERRLRLIIEIGSSAMNMILEDPEIDETTTIRDVAKIFATYLGG
ncbi:TetR family transcriptional regulator [Sneathiella sp. P13V-1]|uniref:TetR/AcrR family transcriptional regulator n=1 Tax=Sneathiella sp. P13V-1 TaxID=2697366 RepID=UPI00187B4ECB|nr:helix-turn-helix domain-containing protein [Sneathiella sp. P13V-1]MBE7637765.1 TetR family transcriptional regulator [Sneathiella sp. P13V-1]